jgi:hypothetical protein
MAVRRTALIGKPGAVAALLHSASKQPVGSALVVEIQPRLDTGDVERDMEQGLGDVVGVPHRTRGVALSW